MTELEPKSLPKQPSTVSAQWDFPRINAFFDALELIAERTIRLTSVSKELGTRLFLLILLILHCIEFLTK